MAHIKLLLRTLLFFWAMVFAMSVNAQDGNFVIQFSRGTAGSRTVGSTGDNNSLRVQAYSYNGGDNSSRQWHWEGNYLLNSDGLYIGFNGTNFIGVNDVANACEMEGYFDSNDNYKLKRKGVNAVMSYGNDNNLIEDSDMEAVKNIIALIQRTGNVGPGGGTIVTPTLDDLTSNAFYIRFTNRNSVAWNAYRVVTDNGVGNALTMTLRGNNPNTTGDAAKNRLWTWVGRKYLRNLQGNYIYLDGTTFKTTADRAQATAFRIYYDTNARPKLRVLNSDSSDGDYVMRAQTVHSGNSPVIASTTLTATDDELELSDYTPVAGQKYFIRFLHNGNDRYIHEMGCPGMADTYNGHDPLLCISRGDVRGGANVNNLPSVSYPPNMRSMTWTLEQNGEGKYHIKSDNGLYMGPTFLLSSSYTGNNPVYSVVATAAEAENFIFRIRESDHLLTLTDEDHPGNTFNDHSNAVPRYLVGYPATSLADNTLLDFVRNDDPLPQDVPAMEDGKWYVLKFAGVEQTLVKVHVDADGYYLFEHDKGRYVCRTETGFGYTLDATNAAQFEVRPERNQTAVRNGWHLECLNGDTPNVKVVVATGDSFSEVYHGRNAANTGDANTVFSFEEAVVPDDIEAERPTMEDGGWYQLYFHDVPICARKVSYVGEDATGNRIYKLQYGTQYVKDNPTYQNTNPARNNFTTTTNPDEAACFTVTLGLGGWQLTRLTDDNNFYGGYTIADKPAGNSRNITFREYLNKPTSYFGAGRLTDKLEDGKKYVFYFDNMLLYGMYDLEMESGKDCDLLGNATNYGGMAWTALEPEYSEEDQEYYYRFQNEFGRYIAWNATTKRYQVTNDASKASRFRLVEGDYGYMLQRLGTSSVFLPGNGITYGVCFNEKAILKSDGTSNLSDNEKRLAAIYFREVTSNDAWFDDSTEELEILHRPSFFQQRANDLGNGVFTREFLQPGTGMTERTLADGTTTVSTQNTPEYRLTRYVKRGDFVGLYLTTSKGANSTNHIAYQRLYLYDTDKPLTHKYFLPYNDNDAYVYKNGLVLGNALTNSNGTNLSKTTTAGARNHFVKLSVLGRLPTDEEQVTFACDFCFDKSADNYVNDLSYVNGSATTAAEGGNLTEPTLSLRQIWTLIDAKVMANELVTKTGDDWLEERTIHFSNKTQGLVKEFVPLNNDLENFWFYKNYTGDESQRTDENLVQVGQGAANANRYYVIETTDHESGITVDTTMPKLPESTNIGDYIKESEYKRRRHISFSYPESRSVEAGTSIEIRVYAVDADGNSNRYNIAKFTIIFDAGTETLPYMDIVGDEAAYSDRSPEALRERCGEPRAYLNFDYHRANGFISPTRSSMENVMAALPLDYSTTNYAFARRPGNTRIAAGWGSSAVGNLHKCALEGDSHYTNNKSAEFWLRSVSDYTGITYSDQYDPGFLFIDASDMPGQVATVSFEGDFCEGSLLMCSGWMSAVEGGFTASNIPHAPGSVVLTVMGRKYDDSGSILSEDVVYSFCPGQLPYYARRADGTVIYPEDNKKYSTNGDYIWQQFYFEFFSNGSDDYYLKIENNAIGTAGGDYMLDDIWIFAILPSFETSSQLPICGGEVELVRLENDFESLLNATGISEWQEGDSEEKTGYVGVTYLDWDKFVTDFKAKVDSIDGTTYTKELFLTKLNGGEFLLDKYSTAYQEVFQASLMRDIDGNIAYTNLQWSNKFKSETRHDEYTFAKFFNNRANRSKVYWAVEDDKRKLIFNGSMDIDGFEYYHNYMMLAALNTVPLKDADRSHFYNFFNVISTCSTRALLYMEPFVEVNGSVGVQDLNEVTHCQNTVETLALHVKAFRIDDTTGELVEETAGSVAFDWWVGNKEIAATIVNFKAQRYSDDTEVFTLQHALKCLRYNYPYATSLDGLSAPVTNPLYEDYTLTEKMLQYLKSLAAPADGSRPQLLLRAKAANVMLDDRYLKLIDEEEGRFAYFCTMPIENDMDLGQANTYYTCSMPQEVKIQVKEVAPRIDLGFPDKDYPDGIDLLSVRLAKKQFEQVNERSEDFTRLHIPIRNVQPQSEGAVGIKNPENTADNVIYLTATTDTEMEDYLLNHYNEENGAVVGTMTYLYGTKDNTNDTPREALALYFNRDFKVREGYSYTLKFPFTERFNGDAVSTRCMGEGAFIMKIVPDYEVWTGAAGNTDWNNDENWRRADYDELYAGNGTTLTTYMKNGNPNPDIYGNIEPASNQDGTPNVNYITAFDRERRQGFAPLYCTNILMMTQETAPAPWLYDHGMLPSGFPDLEDTSSPMLRYDFQGHSWPVDEADEANNPANPFNTGQNVRQQGDIVTELYTSNICDKIAFQPETEIAHTELLTYDKAWVEFAMSKNLWHLVSSPLKNTISGEWYAPSYSARQETTYYEPVEFNVANVNRITLPEGSPTGVTSYKLGYDRFSPAVYQRAWDKAKAVLYERGAEWSEDDSSQTDELGYDGQGEWNQVGSGQEGYNWNKDLNANDYLNRLAYKPMGKSKVNVAIRGGWSGVYNDHTVPYDGGGFSVMPINHFKNTSENGIGYNSDEVDCVFRLPKEDYFYDIWDWSKSYNLNRRVRVYIKDENRPWPTNAEWRDSITTTNTVELNHRGRLRTDDLRPATVSEGSPSGNTTYTLTLKNEGNGSLGFFLACNPFICGLDMQKFFAANSEALAPYYLVLKESNIATDEELTGSDWSWTDVIVNGTVITPAEGSTEEATFSGRQIVPARHAFFVRAKDGGDLNEVTITFTTDMMATTPRNASTEEEPAPARPSLSIRAQRGGYCSEARVELSPDASNTFMPQEDMETFIVSDITSAIPVVYTLTGALATSINRLRCFNSLPLGIISNSTDPATLTFNGVESLNSDVQLYDAYLQTFTQLVSGTSVRVPGSTQNRYFLVTSIDEESLAESDIQIEPVLGGVHISTVSSDPLTQVFVYDISGRRVAHADVGQTSCTLSLPKGAYTVKAESTSNQRVKKVMVIR